MAGKKGFLWNLKVCATSNGTFQTVGKASDVDLDQSSGELDTSCRDDAGWENTEQGLKKWGCDIQHLWVPADAAYVILQAAFYSGDPVYCQFSEATPATGVKGYDGQGIITKCSPPQKLNGAVFVAITIKGQGALAPVTRS